MNEEGPITDVGIRNEKESPKQLTTNKKDDVKSPFECPTCHTEVSYQIYGKHLVSHSHYHRSLGHKDHSEVILSKISDTIQQSPF